MRNTILMAAIALGSAACGPGADAVWLFTYGTSTTSLGDSTCEENFNAADCPIDTGGGENPWTVTVDEEISEGAFFGQILDAPGGEKVLVVGGEVYVGVKESGSWKFTWDDEYSVTETEAHDSGYTYVYDETSVTTTTFTVTLSGGTAVGNAEIVQTETIEAMESDTWLGEEVGFYSGQIFDDTPVFLEGDRVNYADEAECAGGDCVIRGSGTITTTYDFTGRRTDAGRDGYDGVQDAGQEPGN